GRQQQTDHHHAPAQPHILVAQQVEPRHAREDEQDRDPEFCLVRRSGGLDFDVFCHCFTKKVVRGTARDCPWQARRESNPQPAVLETAALPIELLAYLKRETGSGPQDPKARCHASESRHPDPAGYYLMTLATTPAPTVRPPSRIAKRRPSSIAIGWIRLTVIFTLSPGITISTPSGRWQAPVTS